MAKFFFTPPTAVPYTHGMIISMHLNAVVTPETYSVYVALYSMIAGPAY